MNEERAELRAADNTLGTWDETRLQNYWDVRSEARLKGITAHFGALFDLCVVKRSELEEAKRRFKGGAVFGGHNVRDEYGLGAQFSDQGSGASFLAASKLIGAESAPRRCRGTVGRTLCIHTGSARNGQKGATGWLPEICWLGAPACPQKASTHALCARRRFLVGWEENKLEEMMELDGEGRLSPGPADCTWPITWLWQISNRR